MNIVGIRKNPFFLTQINIRKVFQTQVAKDHPLVCLVFTTHSPEIHCLRERPNGGGRENWKVQLLLLCIQPCTDIGSSTMVRALQSSSLSKKKSVILLMDNSSLFPTSMKLKLQSLKLLTAFCTASLFTLGEDFLEA